MAFTRTIFFGVEQKKILKFRPTQTKV